MVSLIQNTQNRGAKALHLKPDELFRSIKRARNIMVKVGELSDRKAVLKMEKSSVPECTS